MLATYTLSSSDAYGLLSSLYTYAIVVVFNLVIAIGVLKLHFDLREGWSRKSAESSGSIRWISITAALIFAIGSAFPAISSWVPAQGVTTKYPWYTTPVVSVCVLGLGILWYFGFLVYAHHREGRRKERFRVERVPQIEDDPPVQISERGMATPNRVMRMTNNKTLVLHGWQQITGPDIESSGRPNSHNGVPEH